MSDELERDERDELHYLRIEKAIERGVKSGMDEHAKTFHAPLDETLRRLAEDKVSLKTLAWAGGLGLGGVAVIQFFNSLGH